MNLFSNTESETKKPETIRTIGLYQPYCSLMLHGKIETRWVRAGKKPPFPLGKYVGYSTKKPASSQQILEWSGFNQAEVMNKVLSNEPTRYLNGHAIWKGNLVRVSRSFETLPDHLLTFVHLQNEKTVIDDNGNEILYHRWYLYFDEIERLKAFEWKHGKQGVGIVLDEELKNIEICNEQ